MIQQMTEIMLLCAPGLKSPSPPSSHPISFIMVFSKASSIRVKTGAISYVYLMEFHGIMQVGYNTLYVKPMVNIFYEAYNMMLYHSQAGFYCLSDEASHHGMRLHPCKQLVKETRMTCRGENEHP